MSFLVLSGERRDTLSDRLPILRQVLVSATAGALLLLAGCASSTATVRPTEATPSQSTSTSSEKPTTRGQLLFEDAVKASEAQKKGKGPSDDVLQLKFQGVLNADSNFAEADYNLGVLAERQGHRDEAINHYKEALRKKPSLRQAAENLAVIQQNSGDSIGAVSMYNEILKSHPEDSSSRAHLAELYRQSGDQDKAMELARAALIRDPRWEPAYRVMMRAYLDRKQLSMARLVALRALKIDESDPEIYYGLGLVLLEEKRPDQAQLQFEKAIKVSRDYLPAHVMLAKLALQDENYAGAESHLKAILVLQPTSAETHLDLGVAYKGLGQYDKAMQEYDAAERINPKLAAIYLNRGIILHRNKDAPERGLELYKKYIALSGGEAALPLEAPVFGLMKEAESIVQVKEQAAVQEKQAKDLEKMQKAQEQTLKNAEDDDKKKKGEPASSIGNEGSKKSGNPAASKSPSDKGSEAPDDVL